MLAYLFSFFFLYRHLSLPSFISNLTYTSISHIFFSPPLLSFSYQYSRNPPAWQIGKSKKQELSLTENGKYSLFWMRILSFNVIHRISQSNKLCLEILYFYFPHLFIEFFFYTLLDTLIHYILFVILYFLATFVTSY